MYLYTVLSCNIKIEHLGLRWTQLTPITNLTRAKYLMECFTSGYNPDYINWLVNDKEFPNMKYSEVDMDEMIYNNMLILSPIELGESINVTCAVNGSEVDDFYGTVILQGKVYRNPQ